MVDECGATAGGDRRYQCLVSRQAPRLQRQRRELATSLDQSQLRGLVAAEHRYAHGAIVQRHAMLEIIGGYHPIRSQMA